MTYSWAAYSGIGEFVLIMVLLIATVSFVILATRLRTPISGPKAAGGVVAFLVAAWLLAIATFLFAEVVYLVQAHEVHLRLPSPPNHVTPVTIACAAASFLIVAVSTPARLRTRVGNAFFCACTGPMVFELPFDLIVMARTTAIPPAPALYQALFFLPLFMIETLTLALAATRPGVHLTRSTALSLAGMFGVFGIWALIGFEYPWGGLPLILNIISKVLAFTATLSFFVRPNDLKSAARRWIRGSNQRRPRPARVSANQRHNRVRNWSKSGIAVQKGLGKGCGQGADLGQPGPARSRS